MQKRRCNVDENIMGVARPENILDSLRNEEQEKIL